LIRTGDVVGSVCPSGITSWELWSNGQWSSGTLTLTCSDAADLNCEGSWSACTSECETATARIFTTTQAQSGNGSVCPTTTDCEAGMDACPVLMFEYEAFPGYQCAGNLAKRIGAGMEIKNEEETRAADVETCLTACSNHNMCTGVSVHGNYKCYMRTGYVYKKPESKAGRTCYEKKITDTYKEDVCTKVAANWLCDSDTCNAQIGVEYVTKYCNVFASKRKIWGQVCETACTGKVTTYSTKADAEHMRCEKSYNYSHTPRRTFGECKLACNQDSTCTMFEMRQFLCRLFNGGSRMAIPVQMQRKEPRTTYCYEKIQQLAP